MAEPCKLGALEAGLTQELRATLHAAGLFRFIPRLALACFRHPLSITRYCRAYTLDILTRSAYGVAAGHGHNEKCRRDDDHQ